MRGSRPSRPAALAAVLAAASAWGLARRADSLGLRHPGRQHPAWLQGRRLQAVAVRERPGAEAALTEAQASAVARLRGLAAKAGLRGVPEGLLQRCCAAAENDVEGAYHRLRDIIRWRQREGVQHLLEKPGALAAERWYRGLLHYGLTGQDRQGRAVMIEAIGQWDMEELDRAARERKEEMLRAHLVVCELLLKQAEESASARSPVQRVPGFVAVLDMEGISLKHNPLAYPQVLNVLKEVSKINARYYPEAVEHVFVVNAPRLFHSIWRYLAPFVLPSSGVRVDVLPKGEFGPLLRECGAACLPVQLGGTLPAQTGPYRG